MNDRGMLPSSETATSICDACISLFDEICDDMKTEYGMVLDNAFWPREALGDLIISKARRHFDTVTDRARDQILSATQNWMKGGIHKELCNDVTTARDRALTDLSLFIDGYTKMLTRKKVARALAYFPKLISSSISL